MAKNTREEKAWADSLNKAMRMKQGATWDNMAREEAIKKAWQKKPKTLSLLQAAKLAEARRKKSSGGAGG